MNCPYTVLFLSKFLTIPSILCPSTIDISGSMRKSPNIRSRYNLPNIFRNLSFQTIHAASQAMLNDIFEVPFVRS